MACNVSPFSTLCEMVKIFTGSILSLLFAAIFSELVTSTATKFMLSDSCSVLILRLVSASCVTPALSVDFGALKSDLLPLGTKIVEEFFILF